MRSASLRLRLTLAIAGITMAVLAGTFYALHQATGADLESRIDAELNEQWVEFQSQALPRHPVSPARVAALSSAYVHDQRYQPDSRILAIEVAGRQVTNQRQVIENEVRHDSRNEPESSADRDATTSLIDAAQGLSEVEAEGAGRLRVLTKPIVVGGTRLGTFRVAAPLKPVTDAQSGLRGTFLAVGLAALAASILLASWVSTLVTRRLRRMAAFASAVDAGDMSHRIEGGGGDEVGVLAESFNHMLDRLEDAFGRQRDFVSDASHELRTPLTVLRGQIELLPTQEDPAERRRTTQTLLAEIGRMNRLVDDLLTLARADSGRLVQRRTVPVADLLDDVRRDLPLLGKRDYRISDGIAGTVDADPDRVLQVFRNVARNAVAHTPDGGTVAIAATPHGGTIEFTVTDDGTGIPPDQLDHVFDRFHRAESTPDRAGSGLGLSIARAIVEAHGGWIRAEAAAGGGTTIRFELPGYSAS